MDGTSEADRTWMLLHFAIGDSRLDFCACQASFSAALSAGHTFERSSHFREMDEMRGVGVERPVDLEGETMEASQRRFAACVHRPGGPLTEDHRVAPAMFNLDHYK